MSGEVGHFEWSQNREDSQVPSQDPVVCSSIGFAEEFMSSEKGVGPFTFCRGLYLITLHVHTGSGQESENTLYKQQ